MRALTLAIAATLATPLASAQLFKCIQPNGKVAYQDSKCEDAAKQSTVRPPSPLPDRPLPSGDERAGAPPQADLEAIVNTLSSFQGCAQDVPGFAAKHNSAFLDWRTRNQAAMTRYGQDPKAQQSVRESLEQQMRDAPKEDEARADRAASCEKDAATWFVAGAAR